MSNACFFPYHVWHAEFSTLQAESVNELVGARTAAAADSALAGLTGGIGALVSALRKKALVLLAELEVWSCFLVMTAFVPAYMLCRP